MKMYNPHVAPGRCISAAASERPSQAEAEAAARTLLLWAGNEPSGVGALDLTAILTRVAGAGLSGAQPQLPAPASAADAAYVATLPDLQNGPESLIKGAKTDIQHVGISNFRLPVRFRTRDGGEVQLETAVTGSVSLEADRKGINMSRIMRSFYKHAETSFSFEVIGAVLDSYLADLDSYDARIMMRFSYPMLKRSLRSGLEGYQYYNVALEMVRTDGGDPPHRPPRLRLFLDLPLLARALRARAPHPRPDRDAALAALGRARLGRARRRRRALVRGPVDLCTAAIPTETQVMVKREDEQAFAELNGANPIFVEDAVRLLCAQPRGRAAASATSASSPATRSRCTATTRCRS